MHAGWSSDVVTAGSLQVHYVRTGGQKPPLVLAHGLSDNGLCWTRLARALADTWDVIMPDARGHGESEAPSEGHSWTTLADDLAAFVTAMNLTDPVLMGHSMGAETVALVAARHPSLVRAVVLEDPPWRDAPPAPQSAEQRADGFRETVAEYAELTVASLMAHVRDRAPHWHEDEILPWAESKKQVSASVAALLSSPRADWRGTAAAITCPALLLTADPEKGAIVTPEIAAEAVSLMGRGKHVFVAGAGHSIHRDEFDAVIKALAAFFAPLSV